MGWIPNIFGSNKPPDALSKLDPKLRKFLEEEAPAKYTPSQPPQPPPAQAQHEDAHDEVAEAEARKPVVPEASLFPDGRYAHLWKTYRPLSQIEGESATDHNQVLDVLSAFKAYRARLKRAVMENCAVQQQDWVACMRNGSVEDQLVMCKYQVRRFERCSVMQTRFLKALGYGADPTRPLEVDEDIQVHSDSLYQRMLQHEEAVEQAKQDGTPIPVFEVRLPGVSPAATEGPDELPKAVRQKLDEMPEAERAAEEAAIRADWNMRAIMTREVNVLREKHRQERQARVDSGQSSLWENLVSTFSTRSDNSGKKN